MKVALVVPKSGLKLNDACPPLNLGYLASYLLHHRPHDDVIIIDGTIGQDVRDTLWVFQPDVVGVTATTPQAPAAYRIGDMLRYNRPDVLTVIGGVHASCMPEEAAERFDMVVVGEGEQAFVNIVDELEQHGKRSPYLKGVVEGQFIRVLDEIPMPAYPLMDVNTYLTHGPPFPNLTPPIMSMVTSRGCPFRCPFCRNSFRREPVRYFSAQRVVDEILYLLSHYPIRSFFFNDDEFVVNKKRLRELASLFKQHGIDKRIVWGCQARVNSLDLPTLQLMKRTGCVVVSPGFESAVPRMLDYLKQGTTTVEGNERALRLADAAGVTIGGSFIFGTPSETLEDMRTTFRWFEDHEDLKFIGINTVIPYPKTQVYERCRELGLLPERIDYRRLVPTSTPAESYIVCNTMPPSTYNKFIVDIQRVAWVITQTRLHPSLLHFFRLARFKTWWWMWLQHPMKMLHRLRLCVR